MPTIIGQHSERNPDGYIFIANESGPPVEHDTKQCPHCGGHFISYAGSGKRRTFCMKCNAVTCGNPACDRCKTWEQKMVEIEAALGIR